MAISRHTKHNKCPVEAVLVVSESSPHYAALRCKTHNKHIQWLTQADYQAITTLTGLSNDPSVTKHNNVK